MWRPRLATNSRLARNSETVFRDRLGGRRSDYLRLLTRYCYNQRLVHLVSFCLFVICCFGVEARAFQDEDANRNPARNSRVNEKVKTRPRIASPKANRVKPSKRTVSEVSLWIVSNPANCKLLIDGEPRGETDANGELELRLLPATYSVRVSRDGYITREADVEVLSAPDAQEVEFTLPVALVSLKVLTDPPGAEVYVDDVYRGTSGPSGALVVERLNSNQAHTLRVRKNGHVQQSTPVTPNTGQVSIKLLPDSVKLQVTTDPPEAEIYLDDAYKGTSTSEGSLIVEQVNPNQLHTLRAKKDGYRQEAMQIPANSTQATIKLSRDPVVLLVKEIKRLVAHGQLVEAYNGLEQLLKDAPDHQESSRLSADILQALQSRSAEMLKRVQPFGIAVSPEDVQEMVRLYEKARKFGFSDETIENLGRYWDLKLLLVQSERSASAPEKETLRRNARAKLLQINPQGLRNPYLHLEMGWSWWVLNDKESAQKEFRVTLELKSDLAYPHFGIGLLAMNTAENETSKSARTIAYGQAIDNFTKAIGLKHDFATAYAFQSLSYISLKRYEEAIASGLQGVAVDPQNAIAHFALGSAYFEKGKSGYRQALNEFNQATTLAGSSLNENMKNAMQQRLVLIKKSLK
jgi:TPR repeat/PEGA domain